MSTFELKMVAIITMIIDHIGLFFFPHIVFLRIIGRISFPLFAFLLANGARHTKNINAYLKRLFIFACISQIPFLLANRHLSPGFHELNILFTLFLGLLAIKYINKQKTFSMRSLTIALACLIGALSHVNYGWLGILSIIFFYLCYDHFTQTTLSQGGLLLTYALLNPLRTWSLINVAGLASLIFIFFYNKKEGPKTAYLFYIFYPAQYVVIFAIQVLIGRVGA